MTDNYLKSWLDRVENLESEQKAIGSDKRDLYTEAKSKGYNTKALRRIVAERKRKDEDEIAADVEIYRAALGMPGASYRSVAEQVGISKSKLQRLVPKKSRGTSEHAPVQTPNPTEGPEVAGSQDGHSEYTAGPDAGAVSTSPPPNKAPQEERTQMPSSTPAPEGGEGTGTHSETRSPGAGASDFTQPVEPTGNEGCSGKRVPDDDDLAIPPFLRRSAA